MRKRRLISGQTDAEVRRPVVNDLEARTAASVHRGRRLFWRLSAIVALLMGTATWTTSAADAALNVWYVIPSYGGGRAKVMMTTFNKTYASGIAYGMIWLSNDTRVNKLYVQRKPIEGALWKRSTTDLASGATTFNWSDSFTMNYSGFKFRICKNNALLPDTCGSAVTVSG